MATSHITNRTDGVRVISDGTRTMTVSPTVGDESFEVVRPTEVYLDRGGIIADGSGVREADQVRAQATFSFMLPDDKMIDGENLSSLMEWWAGGTSSAITTASWASTLTRTDGNFRTLDVLWYPNGTASGEALYTFDNCTIEALPASVARPNTRSITVMSATNRFPTKTTVP